MGFLKRFIIITLLLLPLCSSETIVDMNVNIYLMDGDARIDMFYSSKLKFLEMPVFGEISELRSENATCTIVSKVQKTIRCNSEDSFMISFKLKNAVKQKDGVFFFSYDIPILYTAKKINVMLEMPLGYALSDKVVSPISPPNTEIGTDGRKIFIRWEFKNKEADDIIPLRVYFEKTSSSIQSKYYGIIVSVISSLLIILLVLYLRLIKRKPELVLSVLNEAERIIVEILQNQPGEEIDQNKLVTISGFSKAKVSRIIKSLEERGVVESIRYGRKNKIILKKKFVKEATEQSENKN